MPGGSRDHTFQGGKKCRKTYVPVIFRMALGMAHRCATQICGFLSEPMFIRARLPDA